jgi:hypothetical protein
MKVMLLLIALLLCLGIQQTHSQWIETDGPDSIRALVMDGTTLFAGTWREGVFLSSNSGDSWELLLPSSSACLSFAFTSADIYLGGVNHIFYTSRDSTSWTPVFCGDPSGFVYALAARGDTVFAGTSNGGLFRIWHYGPSLYGSMRVGFKDTAVNSLVFDDGTLYAGTHMGVFSSTDDMHWTALNSGLTTLDTRALVFKGSDLYAGTWGGGVFRSMDHGALWTPVNSGLTNKEVQSFAVTEHTLFAGTSEGEGGVFLSTDNGSNWTGVSEEDALDPWLHRPGWIHGLVVDDTYLYAGERNTGVWRRPLSEMVTPVKGNTEESPSVFALHQNYPNPFNPSTTIKYELPRSSEIRLSVYDMLGREVSVLVNERRDAGVHEVRFDGSGLSSGMFVYRIRAGKYLATKRMILMK